MKPIILRSWMALALAIVGLFVMTEVTRNTGSPRHDQPGPALPSGKAAADNTRASKPVTTGKLGAQPPASASSLEGPTPKSKPPRAIVYGKEFWRFPAGTETARNQKIALQNGLPSLSFRDIMARVSLARSRDSASDCPRFVTAGYTGQFGTEGLSFSPHRPDTGAALAGSSVREEGQGEAAPETGQPGRGAASIKFRTRSVRQGASALYSAGDTGLSWKVEGNTIQACLSASAGLVEHYEIRADGVEATWVLLNKLQTGEDLEINATLAGLVTSGSTDSGQHFADEQGRDRVRIGLAELVESSGARHSLKMEVADNRIRITIPGAALGAAAFPVAIDPVISAEFGTDNPVFSTNPGADRDVSLASDGTNIFAAWSNDGSFIYGTRIDRNGVILDPSGILISADAYVSVPLAAWNGSKFLVAWTRVDLPQVRAARVTGAGTLLDDSPIEVAYGNLSAVASDGNNWLLVFTSPAFGTYATVPQLYAFRINADGLIWGSGPGGSSPFFDPYSRVADALPSLAWSGSNYVYCANNATNGFRKVTYDTNGVAIGAVQAGFSRQDRHAIVWARTNFMMVWQEDVSSNGSFISNYVLAARLVVQNSSLPDFPNVVAVELPPGSAALTTNSTTLAGLDPAIAWDGTNSLAVWADVRQGLYSISCSRITEAGAVLDPGGFSIASSSSQLSKPRVVWNGDHYLVAWQDGSSGYDIRAARISPAGTVIGPASFPVSTSYNSQRNAAAASDGTNCLVIWQDVRRSGAPDIFGARLDPFENVLDPSGIGICTNNSQQYNPALAWSGSNYVAVWKDRRGGFLEIYGTRISRSGDILDPASLHIGFGSLDELHPAVAGCGTNFLVAWKDYRTEPHGDVYGARVTSAGAVFDSGGFPISAHSGDAQAHPAIAGAGVQFLVVWDDDRNGGSQRRNIYGARLTTAGAIQETNGIPICTVTNHQQNPALAWNGNHFLVAWQDNRNDSTPFGGAIGDIYGTRMDSLGAVLDPVGIPICTATNHQQNPVAVPLGSDFRVAWEDLRNGSSLDVYATEVEDSGLVSDPFGHAISDANGADTAPVLTTIDQSHAVYVYQRFEPALGIDRVRVRFESEPPPFLLQGSNSPAGFSLSVTGSSPGTYQIQASSNLVAWDILTNIPSGNGTFQYTDPDTLVYVARFFRALLLP